jgi:hypothetical protein
MKKINYDNALTSLFEEKELTTNILSLEGEDLYKEIAYVLTELSLIDKGTGKKIISENERLLLEASFMEKIRNAWNNLWGQANQQAQQNANQNLGPQQAQAVQQAQKDIAEVSKNCAERAEGHWSIKYEPGDPRYTEENKKKYIEGHIKHCIEETMNSSGGKSIIGKLSNFLNNTVSGRVLTGMVAIGAMFYVTGLLGTHSTTVKKNVDDGNLHVAKVVNKHTQNDSLNHSSHVKVNKDGSLTKVDIGKDGKTVGVIERDFAKTDLNDSQVQQAAQNIVNLVKDINKDPDLGGKPVKSITLKFHSNYSNTDGGVDSDGDGIPDSNDCQGGPCAETHNQKSIDAVLKIVKQELAKDGIPTKVKVKSEIGGLAKDVVKAKSSSADAEQNTTITVDGIDAPIKKQTDTKIQPGPYGPLVDTPPAPKVPICDININGKTIKVERGNRISIYANVDYLEEDGQKFDGILTPVDNGPLLHLEILGGFTDEKNGVTYFVVQPEDKTTVPEGYEQILKDGMYIVPCGKKMKGEDKREDDDINRKDEYEDDIVVPVPKKEFLKGNRNMQLAYLAKNFLPGGESLWNGLGIKEGTVLPSGFFDAALNQGKYDPQNYLSKYYDYLVNNNAFTNKINKQAWLARVRSNKNLALISWIRNTRKNIGGFFKKLNNEYGLGLGERARAFTAKPGETGKAMGTIGDSVLKKDNLIIEASTTFGDSIKKAGFREDLLMKNLPQFMEMLTTMYFGIKGKKIGYDKNAVMNLCKEYGCKVDTGKKFKRSVSKDYAIMDSVEPKDEILKEEINRIKNLMK